MYLESSSKWNLKQSTIHGIGAFVKNNVIMPGEAIDVGITFYFGLLPNISYFGSKINHSYSPTAVLRYDSKNNVYNVYAKQLLMPGTEITIDYRDTPFYIMGPESHYR